jgi:hypothetical protein
LSIIIEIISFMKSKMYLLFVCLFSALGIAQNGINYKALMKDNNGNVISNQSIDIQFRILQASTVIYEETHNLTTTQNGLAITNIGEGTVISGDFNAIDWASDSHFLNVQVNSGSGLVDLGTTEFKTVPYAMSSKDNYWTKNGTDIYTSNNEVGINSVNPEYTLDVRSSSQTEASQLNISNNDKSRYIRFFSGSETFPDPSMSWDPNHNLLFATFDDNTFDFQEKMRISSSGDVGIGITNPEARLDILGGDWNLDAGNPGDLRIGNATHNLRIGTATGGGGAGISRIYSSNHLLFGVADEPIMMIESDGETGFGTTNPSQKVHINGKLKIGDDEKAPSEGTIRYNSTSKSFEGYDGTKWINLGGSSPYGVQGTFNLPNSSFLPIIDGGATNIKAAQDLVAIRSAEQVITGYDSNFPPNPIYARAVYINLFQKNTSSNWVNVLSISDLSSLIINPFAIGIALSEDRFLIGDPEAKEVFEYSYISGNWVFTKTFSSPNTSTIDRFGFSIAIDGQQTIIGAPERSTFPAANYGPGKAYIYNEFDNLAATLSGPGATLGDRFGESVDISNNRALVGAPGDDFGSTSNAGSATVFNKIGNNWSTNSTFFDDSVETDEFYGSQVSLEASDYFYISENNGVDAYLIEDGFWVLKETIAGQGTGYVASSSKHKGFNKTVFFNYNSDFDKIDYLIAAERDVNNLFVNTSSLINGTSGMGGYDITNNEIYTLGSGNKIYIFEY